MPFRRNDRSGVEVLLDQLGHGVQGGLVIGSDGDLRAVVRELQPAYVAYRTDEHLVVGGVAPLELPSHWPAAAAVDT